MSSFYLQSLPKEFFEIRAKTLHQIQLGSTSSKPIGYSPQQIRRAYKLNKLIQRGITGKGQHIAIIDAFGSPIVKKDLQVFCKRFDLLSKIENLFSSREAKPSQS